MNKNSILENYIKTIVKETLEEKQQIQNEDLGAAFVDPIADIFKTALYSVQDMGARVKRTVKTIIKGLPTLFVPFVDADYKGIEDEEEEALNKLEEKYKDVLDRNEAAIYGTDLAPMLFLLDPQKFLGAKLLKTTPTTGLAAIRTMQILTGGTSDLINKFAEKWEKWFKMNKPIAPHGPYNARNDISQDTWGGHGTGMGATSWASGDVNYGSTDSSPGGDLEEAQQINPQAPVQQQQPRQQSNNNSQASAMAQFQKELAAIVSSPNFSQEIAKGNFGQQMGNDIMNIFVGHVAKFMAAKSYDELVNKNSEELTKVNSEIQKSIRQAKPEEVQKIKQIAFLDVKKLYKEFYVKKIKELANGKPHLTQAAQQAITKIQAMQ